MVLLTQESENLSSASTRVSAVAPETAKDHGSVDGLIVFWTVQAKWPTRKATPTISTASGSSSEIVRQHDTAAALRAPVQNPDTTASEAGKGWWWVSTLLWTAS